ncbi:MAG: GNAT family N-acetyltransferase [Bacilli bacterium]|nr:GNAT family N-acetyltransferase [Bacilli bacterium]
MKDILEFKIVDFSNALQAIEVQNSIFEEDGLLNILASLDYDLFISLTKMPYPDDHVKYYLAYYKDEPIGITVFYYYPDYQEEMWLAWFGILPKYQRKGFGKKVLEWSINKVRLDGKKTLRLYTDETSMQDAVNLYKKMGFVGEKYTKEPLDYNCYIYSKSLSNEEVTLWNNRFLGLEDQSSFEREDREFKERIFNIYKNNYIK